MSESLEWRKSRARTAMLAVVLAVGCSGRKPAISPTPTAPARPDGGSYIDLEAGWRIQVITPLLKSGGYVLESARKADVSGSGTKLTVTMEAGSDFTGYERSYYAVEPHSGSRGGVRIRFASAETFQEGKPGPNRDRPVVELFQLPKAARFVRLLYLVRASQADHNMAVVAANDRAGLESLTRTVQADPASGCGSRRGAICQWIPAGIAVRPESRKNGGDWAPVK